MPRSSDVHEPAGAKEAKKYRPDEPSQSGSDSPALPKELYPAGMAVLQQDAPPEYNIIGTGQYYQAVNAMQHLQVDFKPEGVVVRPQSTRQGGWQWGMRLSGCG